MSTTFTELLPPTKSNPKGAAFDWTPSESNGTASGLPPAGVLTIKQKRIYTSYVVCEFPTDWQGRGFHLSKLTEGSDKTEEAYDVFFAKDGPHRYCSCKGFSYTGGCKHVLSLASLLESKQL